MTPIGILAYGSLISDPGREILPVLTGRISTRTPFPVEFGRISGSRGGAPTVVPHPAGKPVPAEILVLSGVVSLDEARTLLWRRETRREGTGRRYRESPSPNAVVVRELRDFCGIDYVLYTDFHLADKIAVPEREALAKAAIESVRLAKPGQDGISYLTGLLVHGIETVLTLRYRDAILRLTGASTLEEALAQVRSSGPCCGHETPR